jgi:hypothetical protein
MSFALNCSAPHVHHRTIVKACVTGRTTIRGE